MKESISRRKFISSGTIALSSLALIDMPAFASIISKGNTVKVALVGVGQRGTGLANLLKASIGIELIACCDVVEKNLQNGMALAAPKAKAYKDYHSMLLNKDVDAVIIATPLYLHYQMVMDALSAGKHVYVEKTMTYDIPQALALVNRMKTSKLVLQVGHQYRYFNMYHKIKEMISNNWLGTITTIESQYNRNSDWRRPVPVQQNERQVNWRMYKEYSGGLLAELCAHQIDVVNWMLDDHPIKVTGLGGIDYWKDGRETYDNIHTIYEYQKGIKSNVTSILSNEHNGYAMRILGSQATIVIQREKAFIYPEATKKEYGIVDGVTGATVEAIKKGQGIPIEYKSQDGRNLDPTAYALLDFAECIRNNKKPFSNVETGRDAAIAVHMGNQTIETGNIQLWKPEYNA